MKRHSVSVDLKGTGGGQLSAEIRKGGFALRDMKKYAGDAGKGSAVAAQEMKKMGGAAKESARHMHALSGVAGAAGRIIGMAAAAFGVGKIIGTAKEMEVLRAALTTVTGSAEAAAATFGGIQEWASRTPYSVQQATEAFTRLKAMGLDPTEAALTSYGNTAAATGKSLMQMVEAVADAATGEFERLKEFGIRASRQGDQVAFTFRGVTETVKMNSNEIQDYLKRIGDVDFAGAMDQRAKTVDGALSNLGDSFDRLFDTIGQSGLNDMIIGLSRSASGVMDAISEWTESGAIVEYVTETLRMFGIDLDATAGFAREMWQTVLEWGGKVLDFVRDLPANWRIYWAEVVAVVDRGVAGISAHWSNMAVAGRAAWESLRYAGEQAWNYLRLGAAQAIDGIIKSFAAMVAPIGNTLSALGMDSMAAGVRSVETSLRSFAVAEVAARDQIAKTTQAHWDRSAALDGERDRIETTKQARIAAADASVGAARTEAKALLDNRDAAVARALELNKASKEEQKLAGLSQFATGSYQANTAAQTENAKATGKASKAKDAGAKAAEAAAKAEEKHTKSLWSTIYALDPARKSAEDYFDALEDLDAALAANLINEREHQALLTEAGLKYQYIGSAAESAAKSTESAAKNMREQADPMAVAWENAIKRIDDTFADLFTSAFRGWSEFRNSLKAGFTQLLGELAYAAVKNRIMIGFGVAGSGGTAAASGGGALGQGGSWLQSLGGGIGSMLGGNSIGMGLMGLGDKLSPGLLANAGMHSNLMYGGAGLLGGLLGSTAGGYGSAGGSIGAIAGMALAGPFGAALGGALGSAVGSLFGAKWKTKDGGVDLSFAGGDFAGSTYESQSKKKLFSTSRRTITADLDAETARAVTSALDQVQSGIETVATAWGKDATAAIEGYSNSTRISLKGLSEEQVSAALQGWVDGVSNDLLAAVMPEYNHIIRAAGDRASELLQPLAQLGQYIRADFAPQVQQSLWEAAHAQSASLRQIIAQYDGTVDATVQMGALVSQRYAVEQQLLNEINGLRMAVSDMFTGTRERFFLDTASTEEIYTYYRGNAEALAAQLNAATDPAEIQRLTSQINQSILSAWGQLNDEQKVSLMEGFRSFTDGVDQLAQRRLDQAQSSLMHSHQQITDQINRALGAAADRQMQAANAQMAAAQALVAAAQQQAQQGDPNIIRVWGSMDAYYHHTLYGSG